MKKGSLHDRELALADVHCDLCYIKKRKYFTICNQIWRFLKFNQSNQSQFLKEGLKLIRKHPVTVFCSEKFSTFVPRCDSGVSTCRMSHLCVIGFLSSLLSCHMGEGSCRLQAQTTLKNAHWFIS